MTRCTAMQANAVNFVSRGILHCVPSNVLALHEANADGMSGISLNTQASVACLDDAKMVKSDGTLSDPHKRQAVVKHGDLVVSGSILLRYVYQEVKTNSHLFLRYRLLSMGQQHKACDVMLRLETKPSSFQANSYTFKHVRAGRVSILMSCA